MGHTTSVQRLPPIPSPAGTRWREIRTRFVPPVFFLAMLGLTAWVWQNSISAYSFLGSAEARQSMVSSPFIGTITRCHVQPFQSVKRGDPLLTISAMDARTPLDILRLRLQVAASQLQPTVGERNAVDFERLRLEGLRLGVELAIAKVDLERAESELRRTEKLFKDNLVSADAYESAVKARDSLKVEVEEKPRLITGVSEALIRLKSIGDPSRSSHGSTLSGMAQLEAELATLTTNQVDMVLTAPISGSIAAIYRSDGENVTAGEALISIHSQDAERIVGYIRQPFQYEPIEGMGVEIRTRNPRSVRIASRVQRVGVGLQAITNALALVRQGTLVDMGLPVVVNIPVNLRLRPGEIVELTLQPSTDGADSSPD